MTPDAAKALTRAVEAAIEQVNALTSDTPSVADDSHALLRLHAAGLLNAMVTYLLIPAWHEHPNLAPKGPDTPVTHFSLPPDKAERALAVAASIRRNLDALSAVHTDPAIGSGFAEVRRRIVELEAYAAATGRRDGPA